MARIPFPNVPADEMQTYLRFCRQSGGTPTATPNPNGTYDVVCDVELTVSTEGNGDSGE